MLLLLLLLQVCSQEQLLVLVHEGGLLSKLRGLQPQHSPGASMSFMMMSTLGPTIAMLTSAWTNKAHELSKQSSKRMQGGLRRAGGLGFLQAAAGPPARGCTFAVFLGLSAGLYATARRCTCCVQVLFASTCAGWHLHIVISNVT